MTDDFNDESLDELISKKLKYEKKRNNTNNSNEITEEKRDLVNIIIKLHSHNRNIRETFYKEKIQLLNYIAELEGKNFNNEFNKIIAENNRFTSENKNLKIKLNELEREIENFHKKKGILSNSRSQIDKRLKDLIIENECLIEENEKLKIYYQDEIVKLKRKNSSNYLSNSLNRSFSKSFYSHKSNVNISKLNKEKIRSRSTDKLNMNSSYNYGDNSNYTNTDTSGLSVSYLMEDIRKIGNFVRNNTHMLKEIRNTNFLMNIENRLWQLLREQNEFLVLLKKKHSNFL